MRLHAPGVLLCLALMGQASPALAVEVHSPPGNSAVDQYQEVVPDSGGGRPVNSIGSGNKTPALSRRQQTALQAQGSAGAAVVQFTQATAPEAVRLPAKSKPASPADFSASSKGAAPVSATLDRSLTSGDTPGGSMGLALPLILGFTTLGGAAVFLLRRRGVA